MPNTNAFLTFAAAAAAGDIDSDAVWAALTARSAGFTSGVLPRGHLNKALRQSASAAAMIGQFTADYGPSNVLDDGNIATLEAQFIAALKGAAKASPSLYTVGTINAQTIAANVSTRFTSITNTTNTFANSSWSSGNFTIGAGEGGVYIASVWMNNAAHAVANIFATITVNGASGAPVPCFQQQFGTADIFSNTSFAGNLYVNAGDVVSVALQQQNSTSASVSFSGGIILIRIGA